MTAQGIVAERLPLIVAMIRGLIYFNDANRGQIRNSVVIAALASGIDLQPICSDQP
jgi:hypothetical protein